MSHGRLGLFLDRIALPESGDIAVFGARADSDIDALPRARVRAVCSFRPDFDRLAAAGYAVSTVPPEAAALAVVLLPRSKQAARAMVAAALDLAGRVIIDGQKTDGIDSLLREMRGRAECSPAFAKAHGKTFMAEAARGTLGDRAFADRAFADWAAAGDMAKNRDGFFTRPGVFSADGADPGSALLAAALPARMPGRGADLGAGWGFLAAAVLGRADVISLDLVEADAVALDCARANVADPRARLHWADATTWRPEAPLDWVVMNPPFHEGRRDAPALGQGFLGAAAAMLAPKGWLMLVANRHLPYEAALRAGFRDVEEFGGDARFKLIRAARPSRGGR